MCVLCVHVLSPCLQVCVVPKISHPPQSSKLMPFETYVCFVEETEQGWKFEIPQIFDFEKSGFFIGGRAYHRFHGWVRFRSLLWVKWICEAPKTWPQSIFYRSVFLYNALEFLINWCTRKKAKFWGWISPNLFKFSHLSGVCFIRKVHWGSILKSTYRYTRIFWALKT